MTETTTFSTRTHQAHYQNGMTLLVYENHANPTVQMCAAWRAGQFLDPSQKPGLAHTTASMLMRGTRSKSKLEIAEMLEDVGAELHVFANRFLARAAGHSLSKHSDRLLGTLAEVLREPAFPNDELEKLKQQVVGQLKRQQEHTDVRAFERFSQLVYDERNPFYSPPIEKRIASVESLLVEDVQSFYEHYYAAKSLILVVVGDVDAGAIVGQVNEMIGDWPEGTPVDIDVKRTRPGKGGVREVVRMKDKVNVDVVVGHAGQLRRTDPDYYAAYIANAALGHSTLSSRLGLRVRDQEGLTYGVVSRFLEPGIVDGPWAVNLSVNAENVNRAIDLTREIIESYVDEGITSKELEDEKSSFVGSFIVSLGTNAGLASHLLTAEVFGLGPQHLDELPQLVTSVTREEVNEALRRYIHPEMLITVIAGEYPTSP